MLIHNAVYFDTATLLIDTVDIVSLRFNHSFSVEPKSWSTAIDSIYMNMNDAIWCNHMNYSISLNELSYNWFQTRLKSFCPKLLQKKLYDNIVMCIYNAHT